MTGAKTNERPGTRAQVRYLRISASKARVVLDLIRNKPVGEAARILEFSERGVSKPIAKVLDSAVANAEHNDEIPAEELFVSACFADEGPTLKRFRPRARGRAGRINKRTCHITVIVSRLSDEQLDAMRTKAESRTGASADAAAARRRRVAQSRGDDTATAEAESTEEEVVETETPETETPEVQGLVGTAEGSDDAAEGSDDTADAPYGDGSHGLIDGDGSVMPDGFPVKGNADSMLYHNPDSPHYGRTKAEVWFASDEAAEAAGFSKPASQQQSEDATEGDA